MISLKRKVVEHFVLTQEVLSFANLALEEGVSESEIVVKFNKDPNLDSLCGLTYEQAKYLLLAFGRGALFEPDLEQVLLDLEVINKKITDIEKKRNG